MGIIYTIGYGNLAFEDFLNLLKNYNIKILVDIRSQPYSRHRPEYRKQNLEAEVTNEGLKYLYLGDKLGGKPEDRKYYNHEGNVDYRALAEAPRYLEGVRKLVDLSLKANICLMCAEADPGKCHRALLVSETLWQIGKESLHILHNGSILRHGVLRERPKPDQGDLFEDAD